MRTFYTVLSFTLLSLFFSCGNYNNTVQQTYDEVKKKELQLYELDLKAKSLWKHKKSYSVALRFLHSKKLNKDSHLLQFHLNLKPNLVLEDSIYFILGKEIIPVPSKSIHYSLKKHHNTNTETQIIEQKNAKKDKKTKSEDKETKIITNVDITEWKYNYTRASFILPDNLVKKLAKTTEFDLRIYVDSNAYTMHVKKRFTKRINRVYQ